MNYKVIKCLHCQSSRKHSLNNSSLPSSSLPIPTLCFLSTVLPYHRTYHNLCYHIPNFLPFLQTVSQIVSNLRSEIYILPFFLTSNVYIIRSHVCNIKQIFIKYPLSTRDISGDQGYGNKTDTSPILLDFTSSLATKTKYQ